MRRIKNAKPKYLMADEVVNELESLVDRLYFDDYNDLEGPVEDAIKTLQTLLGKDA